MQNKVILFELNEVPWRVLEKYVEAHPTSALSRVLDQGASYVTETPDRQLSPWTTWSSVHRGVSDAHHEIVDFGQELEGINERYPRIWDLAAKAGLRVGNCGSLHTYPLPSYLQTCAFWIPDAFAPRHECKPVDAEVFQEINLQMSRESGRNVSRRIPTDLALRLLLNARQLGITAQTTASVAAQLVKELASPRIKGRRRTFQSILSFDIFFQQLASTQPDFCSFFTNHVASAMHRYWAATFPGDYARDRYDEGWRRAFGHEIEWAMAAFDRMLAKLVRFADRNPQFSIWIASSMGQAAVDSAQIERQVLLVDIGRFMTQAGVPPHEWERRPAMEPVVMVKVTEKNCAEFERIAKSVRIAGEHSLACVHVGHGVFRLHPGVIQDAKEEVCEIEGRRLPFSEVGFANVAIEDETGQSAYHVREGSLIVYSPSSLERPANRSNVSTLEIAPAILRSLGVDRPTHMVDTRIAA